MVVQLGSMAIKGVFKAGSLLSGLGSTSGKLKEVQQRSKSTTTEMKRMTKGAKMLSGALAAIGVAGFSALLMTTPQLAGSLAKIKYEMQRIAWAIGEKLKPALDAVATILRGIRTGDWETVNQGASDLYDWLVKIAAEGTKIVIDVVFGEGSAEKAKTDFDNWWATLKSAYEEGDLGKFTWTLVAEPVIWAAQRISDWLKNVAVIVGTSEGRKRLEASAKYIVPQWGWAQKAGRFIEGWGKGEPTRSDERGFGGGYQTGGYVPQTGMYKLHAGETVTMKGSSGMGNGGGSSNAITLDFSGANINLSGGIQLDQFADVVSNKIAERQRSLTY